ncbi:hypothetical protein HDU98_007290 [Podochytrium sp. JEL0797]|nr:hypothetical protein HDU98_007290 [Podochytrium sp. JEL0797]
MSGYLMDLFVERERVKALKVMGRAFRPGLAVTVVARELGFCGGVKGADEEREGVEECVRWLRGLGAPFVEVVEEREVTVGKGKKARTVVQKVRKEVGVMELSVDMKAGVGVFVQRLGEVLGKGVDIKGQIASSENDSNTTGHAIRIMTPNMDLSETPVYCVRLFQ